MNYRGRAALQGRVDRAKFAGLQPLWSLSPAGFHLSPAWQPPRGERMGRTSSGRFIIQCHPQTF
jgi:hypothetical protein